MRATTGQAGAYGVVQGGVFYDAAAGEANRVTIALSGGSIVTVRDEGAAITAGTRCSAVNAHEVRCDIGAQTAIVNVDVKDLDDEVTVGPSLYGILVGGDGNDRLIGGCQAVGDAGDDVIEACNGANPYLNHNISAGPGDDTVTGGDSPDTIQGGGGLDVLRGGPGSDSFADSDGTRGEAGSDVIDGGPGERDVVYYSARTVAVRVDLSRPGTPQGATGEADLLSGVEDVAGGSGSDTLTGDDAANRLDGGGGSDTLVGLGGNDLLLDGAGTDVVAGGTGNDEIVTRDLYADRASCGPGRDRALADTGDTLAPGCESIDRKAVDLIPGRMRIGVRGGVALLRLACADLDELPRVVARQFESCRFSIALKLRVGGRLVSAGRTTCGIRGCSPLRLPRTAWRLLKRHRQLTGVLAFRRVPAKGALLHRETALVKVRRA